MFSSLKHDNFKLFYLIQVLEIILKFGYLESTQLRNIVKKFSCLILTYIIKLTLGYAKIIHIFILSC